MGNGKQLGGDAWYSDGCTYLREGWKWQWFMDYGYAGIIWLEMSGPHDDLSLLWNTLEIFATTVSPFCGMNMNHKTIDPRNLTNNPCIYWVLNPFIRNHNYINRCNHGFQQTGPDLQLIQRQQPMSKLHLTWTPSISLKTPSPKTRTWLSFFPSLS